jgi:hypothetical protein
LVSTASPANDAHVGVQAAPKCFSRKALLVSRFLLEKKMWKLIGPENKKFGFRAPRRPDFINHAYGLSDFHLSFFAAASDAGLRPVKASRLGFDFVTAI